MRQTHADVLRTRPNRPLLMGFFDDIGSALGGVFGGAAGGIGQYASAKALQEDAQQFQTSFYKQRYQRQMEDMRAAGLNPILAYKTGVPGTASASIASAGSQDYVRGAKAPSEIKEKRARAGQATSATGYIRQQTLTEAERTRLVRQTGNKEAQLWQNAIYEGQLLRERVPEAQAIGAYDRTSAGQLSIQAERATGLVGGGIGNIIRLRRGQGRSKRRR